MNTLKYYFECHFDDGSIHFQSLDDVSLIDPTKSSYYDVLQSNKKIVMFGFMDDDHTYAVDLIDGHFEIDGIAFKLHDEKDFPSDMEYKLVYFRRHTRTMVMGQTDSETHTVVYHLGWEAKVGDETIQRTINVA